MTHFYQTLNSALQRDHFALPTLIISQSRLDENLARA